MYKTQNPEVIARQKLHDKKVHLQLFSEQYYAGFATARKSSDSLDQTLIFAYLRALWCSVRDVKC